jgi:hypothetical protein
MIEALVRIVTSSGMRLEYINDWISKDESVVLNAQNGFCMCTSDNVHVRVGEWGSDTFRVERASAAGMICPVTVSNVQYDASDEEEAVEVPKTVLKKRKRAAVDSLVVIENASSMMELLTIVPERKRRKCMNSCLIPAVSAPVTSDVLRVQLFMPDSVADYVWIIPFRIENVRRTIIDPYCFRPFSIENCCGSVTGLFDVNFRELNAIAANMFDKTLDKKKRKRSKRSCTIIPMLGGTLTLCPDRYQIDFRGARSVRLLKADLEGMVGQPVDETKVGTYMMVLKGCLGAPVVTTSADCYIAVRMAPWYNDAHWHNDVGEMIELREIRWGKLFNEVPDALCSGKASACITRRGGVMLRIVFPPKTVWTPNAEDDILAGGRRLMDQLLLAVSGKEMS